ncbi:MAG: hypothetical protein SVU32_04790, partial [Candidatus Nanohaloarchaea archaeon]|nr:hypothetical protein [Candidatus Nanohaloarchaea archaeon]
PVVQGLSGIVIGLVMLYLTIDLLAMASPADQVEITYEHVQRIVRSFRIVEAAALLYSVAAVMSSAAFILGYVRVSYVADTLIGASYLGFIHALVLFWRLRRREEGSKRLVNV